MAPNPSYLKKNKDGIGEKALSTLFSIAFHMVFLMALFLAAPLFRKHEKIPEIYTVRLFYPEARSTSSQRAKTQKEPTPIHEKKRKKTTPKKVQAKKKRTTKKKAVKKRRKKVVKRRRNPKPKRAPREKKAVSTRPKKPTKRQKKVDEDRLLKERLAQIKRRVVEKREEQYLAKRLQEIKKKARGAQGTSHITSRTKGARPQGENAILQRYFTKIWEIIRSRWVLPQGIIDKKGIEAIVDLTISKDGRIIVKRFEKRSREPLFDQSVERALEGLESLPPIPRELGVSTLDIGVRFRPED